MSHKTYEASWGRRVWLVSVLVTVLLRFGSGLVVVSPDNPRAFARDVARELEKVRSRTQTQPQPQSHPHSHGR